MNYFHTFKKYIEARHGTSISQLAAVDIEQNNDGKKHGLNGCDSNVKICPTNCETLRIDNNFDLNSCFYFLVSTVNFCKF